MWAGGTVRRIGPLLVGSTATRRSYVLCTHDKVGRSGPMTLVTVRHEISQDGRVVIQENQDIVYRQAALAPAPPAGAGQTDHAR